MRKMGYNLNSKTILGISFISNMDYKTLIGECQHEIIIRMGTISLCFINSGPAPQNKSMNSIALSERLGVSHSYLKKIIKCLVNEGLIISVPGKYGGFSLAKSLEEITFYDVFVAVEGRGKIFASQQLLKQFLGEEEGQNAQKCAVTDSLEIIENTLVSTLTSITLGQVYSQIQSHYDLKELHQWVEDNA